MISRWRVKRVGFAVGDYDPNFMLALDPGYSTYLGGSGGEIGFGIAVDSSGNVYVMGDTTSSNFPTLFPYQGSNAGDYDVFVTKIDTMRSGNDSLVYSTYLGGSGYEQSGQHGIATGSSGSAYVTGTTHSSDFPTLNPYQGSHGGGIRDVFVTKLSSSGNTLIYTTFSVMKENQSLSTYPNSAGASLREVGPPVRWKRRPHPPTLDWQIQRLVWICQSRPS